MPTRFWLLVCLLLSSILSVDARAANTIQVENAKQGTTAWQLNNYASNHEIEGYASSTSVNRGGQIELFVNTIDRNFTVEIYRTGWYGGTGGRLIAPAVQLAGTAQPSCPTVDSTTGLIECNWTNPYVLQIPNDTSDPTDWCSGVYLAKLVSASGYQSYVVFVVRDDARPSSYLFQSSVNTYQAYNNWGGRSLYSSNSDFQARKVSYNRPYASSQGTGQYLDSYEYPMVRFLEREGYDVTYASDVDVHENSNLLLSHSADLIVGHGEYWSWEMRSNVIAARDQGISLGIFAANTCFWQMRFEPSGPTGAADRTMVAYKQYALSEDPDYINGDTSKYYLVTTNWRANPVNLPEDAFIGVMFGSDVSTGDIVVNDASNWVFNNTGLQNGSHLPNLLGDEVDSLNADTPPGTVLLSHSPYQLNGSTLYSDMTVYTAASGATVFAAGTIIWSWGLDGYNGGTVSAAAQQMMTRNLLARFAGQTQSTVSLSLVTVNPTSVTGGSSSTGTVTLSGVAPSGGATVTLTSSNTSAAQVPASMTVAAGATTATFTVTTSAVVSSTAVTITGSYNSGTKAATLTVNPSGGGTGSTALVQQKTGTYSAAAGVVVNLNAAPQAGSALVLFSANNNVSVSEVSGGGVTWARGVVGGSHSVMEIWYGLNSSGSGTTITVSYNGTGSGGVNVSEFSGVAPSNAVDVAPPTNAGVTTNPITPAAVTSNASDLIVGAAADTSVTATTAGPTNSFIALTEAANTNKIIPAYRIVTATGSYSTSWTEGSGGWDSAIVALRASGTTSSVSLSSVTVSPTSVTGGSSSTGTVTLSGVAPSGGATVTLTSSNTSAAQVPASVTVAAGATSATFTITTGAVASVTTVTVTGSYNGGSKTATLTVNPTSSVSLSSVTVSPTSVTGGSSSTGTVTLSGVAPSGGATVTLTSSNTSAAQVPASVTVAAGATTATFTVTTSAVVSSTAVTITGSYNSGTKAATLTVNPSGEEQGPRRWCSKDRDVFRGSRGGGEFECGTAGRKRFGVVLSQ